MKRTSLLLSTLLLLAACQTSSGSIGSTAPRSTTGGTCHDGTVLTGHEVCR